ncbi:amino acid permease [Candidatus Woesearchaeota archaeon]|nr:MAG: amino acid permease [Candidatus Woesearchaeota archaeon]
MAELQRTLSYPVLLIITINSVMGTGIFFLPAVGAAVSGPASIIAWVIMSIIALAISLVFAELVGMYPKSGGIYEYTKQAFGHFWSFLFGWMTLVAANITIAMLIVGAVQYLNPLMPPTFKIGASILFVLIFNYIAYRGMQTSAFMLVSFGLITLGTLLALTIPGIRTFSLSHLTPFFTSPPSMIFLTVFLIAETFFGWETATFLAEETKDPERTMPRAMWVATLIIAVLSILFVTVSLANYGWQALGASATPLADLSSLYFGPESVPLISLLVYLSIIGSVAGWIVSSPRLIMSLAKDRLFIHQLAAIHPRHKTPHRAIIFQTIVTSILIILGSARYRTLLELLIPLVLILYGGVVVSFLILRFRKPDEQRPFRAPLGTLLGLSIVAALMALLVGWVLLSPEAIHLLRLIVSFVFLGIPVFLMLTAYYDPEAIIRFNSLFAYLSLWLENLFLPKRIRRRILERFEDLEQKHVLDYGAGVGTLTLQLAQRVGPNGRVTATDISAKNIRILNKRLKKRGITHVFTIHDPHQVNRVHPQVSEVDVVFSVGMLSYVQDLKKVLRELARILPHKGRICFVEYVDFFRVLPNPKWIDDPKQLENIFREEGFLVQVEKVRGLFWNYLLIHGEKRLGTESRVPYI